METQQRRSKGPRRAMGKRVVSVADVGGAVAAATADAGGGGDGGSGSGVGAAARGEEEEGRGGEERGGKEACGLALELDRYDYRFQAKLVEVKVRSRVKLVGENMNT